MKMLGWAALLLSAFLACAIAMPAAATTPLPQCMNTGGSYVPCDGVAPIDANGNLLDWALLLQGSATAPRYTLDASTGTIGAAAPNKASLAGAKDQTGNLQALLLDALNRLLVDDPNNASFAKRTTLVAATDYTASAFRAVEVTCSAPATVNWILLGETASSAYTLASGPSYSIAYQVKSVDAVPPGCALRGLN